MSHLPQARKRRDALLFAAILLVGLWLRLWNLDSQPLWADEAETSINALTILQHGRPVDHYLGLPIFENTLLQPWPGHPEYEFKDISYSKKGLAIYHGWLPLYATALSFRLLGVEPTKPGQTEFRLSEWRHRTIAARLPSVFFGMALLPLLFLAGRMLGGTATGWTAMLCGALFTAAISHSRQARYYSATVLFSLASAYLLARFLQKRRWQDAVLAGLVMAALFHSHLLSFAIMAAFYAVASVWLLWKHPSHWTALALLGAIVTVFTAPWLLATGFLEQAVSIPSARHYLSLPQDLWIYPLQKIHYTLLGTSGAVALLWATRPGSRLHPRWREELSMIRSRYLLLLTWMLACYLFFLACIPLASFFYERLTMLLLPACILSISLLFTVAARLLNERHTRLYAAGLTIVFLTALGLSLPTMSWEKWQPLQVLKPLQALHAEPGTRIYASPSEQLVLTFYTGIPVQSIAPVRKSFLDEYPHTIAYLERIGQDREPEDPVSPKNIERAARLAGQPLPHQNATALSTTLATRRVREQLSAAGKHVEPQLRSDLPHWALAILERQTALDEKRRRRDVARAQQSPIFRGYAMHNWAEWWPIFFYRFVDPDKRRGEHANFNQRIHKANAHILESSWILHVSGQPTYTNSYLHQSNKLRSLLLRP